MKNDSDRIPSSTKWQGASLEPPTPAHQKDLYSHPRPPSSLFILTCCIALLQRLSSFILMITLQDFTHRRKSQLFIFCVHIFWNVCPVLITIAPQRCSTGLWLVLWGRNTWQDPEIICKGGQHITDSVSKMAGLCCSKVWWPSALYICSQVTRKS